VSAGLRACWSLTRRIELAPCLGIVVDRVSASAFGAARVSEASSLTWSPALGIPLAAPRAVRARGRCPSAHVPTIVRDQRG